MRIKLLLSAMTGLLAATTAYAVQDQLAVNTAINGPVLNFDWPAVQIGVGSYEDGPTGLTIFHFPGRVSAVVDVLGGAPGTANTDALRLGYGNRFVAAIIFSGGSSYGEEAITAVMTGLKEQGTKSGLLGNIAFAAGAIIYDFQGHRLNEIYPDKRLAQAALHDLRPGVFPLGARGAGRMAMQGSFFGCAAHSGQGGAFRQVGDTKVAAFTVVNALGSITDRDGQMVKCHRDPAWGDLTTTSELLARTLEQSSAPPAPGPSANTTISLVVTNRRMSPADLQRLAVQVHTSMARAIQPFSTYADGDTLYAVSTQEVGEPSTRPTLASLDAIAAEAMWDAVLASVPEEPDYSLPADVAVSPESLAGLVGHYRFGPNATLEVWVQDEKLMLRLMGRSFLDLRLEPMALKPASATEFYVESRYHTRLAFTVGPAGQATAATVNAGQWAQHGERVQ